MSLLDIIDSNVDILPTTLDRIQTDKQTVRERCMEYIHLLEQQGYTPRAYVLSPDTYIALVKELNNRVIPKKIFGRPIVLDKSDRKCKPSISVLLSNSREWYLTNNNDNYQII